MSSPHLPSPNMSVHEDEYQKASDSLNAKEVMKLLKQFSSLGCLHSKMNFLFTCIKDRLVPKGFKNVKWSIYLIQFPSKVLPLNVCFKLH